jgi:SET domain-containing protein
MTNIGFWFAHQINHKSGDVPNCKINEIGVIRAIKKIGPGDEIFIYYNWDSFCKACNKDI